MKKEEKKERKKAPYEKPVLTKFGKLADVTAGVSEGALGCTRL